MFQPHAQPGSEGGDGRDDYRQNANEASAEKPGRGYGDSWANWNISDRLLTLKIAESWLATVGIWQRAAAETRHPRSFEASGSMPPQPGKERRGWGTTGGTENPLDLACRKTSRAENGACVREALISQTIRLPPRALKASISAQLWIMTEPIIVPVSAPRARLFLADCNQSVRKSATAHSPDRRLLQQLKHLRSV